MWTSIEGLLSDFECTNDCIDNNSDGSGYAFGNLRKKFGNGKKKERIYSDENATLNTMHSSV